MRYRYLLHAAVLRVLAGVACVLCANCASAGNGLERHLRDEYRGKKFVLRGFYAGDRLHYDSSGNLIGSEAAGDWTTDGFVQVKDIRPSHHGLLIEAGRPVSY